MLFAARIRAQARACVRSADAANGGSGSRRFVAACRNVCSSLALFCRRLFAAIGEGDKARRFRFMAVAKRSHSCGSVWQLFKKQKRGHTIAMVCLPAWLSLKSMRQQLRYGQCCTYRIGERVICIRPRRYCGCAGLCCNKLARAFRRRSVICFCSG